ncbi:MAG: glycosyltransferase family 2 protein [Candidatus Omnitrophota bacterium]
MRISIITGVRDDRAFIENCITSVLGQGYRDVEYIVIDGGSTDGTCDVISRYRDSISKVVFEKDGGIYEALNNGIEIATGEVVGFLHSDDLYAGKGVLEQVAEAFKRSNADSCYGDIVYVGRENTDRVIRYWRNGQYDINRIKKGWSPAHPSLFVRKDVYKKFGKFDTRFKIAADYELKLRLLYRHRISTMYIPQVLIKMRWGGMSTRDLVSILRKSKEDYAICKRYNLPPFRTVLKKNLRKLPQFLMRQGMDE